VHLGVHGVQRHGHDSALPAQTDETFGLFGRVADNADAEGGLAIPSCDDALADCAEAGATAANNKKQVTAALALRIVVSIKSH
jgi:hypothetical protein